MIDKSHNRKEREKENQAKKEKQKRGCERNKGRSRKSIGKANFHRKGEHAWRNFGSGRVNGITRASERWFSLRLITPAGLRRDITKSPLEISAWAPLARSKLSNSSRERDCTDGVDSAYYFCERKKKALLYVYKSSQLIAERCFSINETVQRYYSLTRSKSNFCFSFSLSCLDRFGKKKNTQFQTIRHPITIIIYWRFLVDRINN